MSKEISFGRLTTRVTLPILAARARSHLPMMTTVSLLTLRLIAIRIAGRCSSITSARLVAILVLLVWVHLLAEISLLKICLVTRTPVLVESTTTVLREPILLKVPSSRMINSLLPLERTGVVEIPSLAVILLLMAPTSLLVRLLLAIVATSTVHSRRPVSTT
jgi:hypothetical protein